MNILVTGGLGTVGRPLVQRLLSHGHRVRVLDRTGEGCIEGAECVAGDVTDFIAVRECVRGMEAAVHLAALTHPAAGPGHEIYRINCTGTFNLYEAAAQEGIRRVVCASSINALGYNFGVRSFPIEYFPLDEDHPTYTTDAYSFSKRMNEETAAYYWRRDGISGVQFRLPSVYPSLGHWRDMMRKFMGRSRQAAQALLRMPEAERRARVARVLDDHEQRRLMRLSEKPWDQRDVSSSAFEKVDPVAAASFGYTDFWTCIRGEDAAQAFEKASMARYEGSHPLFICEDQNTLGLPSELLANLFYPTATLRRPLRGSESLLSFERARQLIDFTPMYHISEWLGETTENS